MDIACLPTCFKKKSLYSILCIAAGTMCFILGLTLWSVKNLELLLQSEGLRRDLQPAAAALAKSEGTNPESMDKKHLANVLRPIRLNLREDGHLDSEEQIPSDESLEQELTDEDYERMIQDDERRIVPGLGDNGEPVELYGKEAKRAEADMKREAYNIELSKKIALNRTLPDARHPRCKTIKYPKKLPTASVVIVFTDESLSTLLRTVHSVINRSPPRYLKEIILVDDCSLFDEVKGKLDYYVKTRLPKYVKVFRFMKRQGLIRARLKGAKEATGEVLVFLDTHCEVCDGWLQPMLARIKEDRRNVALPIIDSIDAETLEYQPHENYDYPVGTFSWSGSFDWMHIPKEELERVEDLASPLRLQPMLARIKEDRRNVALPIIDGIDAHTLEYLAPPKGDYFFQLGTFRWDGDFDWMYIPSVEMDRVEDLASPMRTPTMAGGLFAMDRKYFFEIGSYDEKMDVWGGENLEISFRIWQCGGTMETIPCSRVGHMFRSFHSWSLRDTKDTHAINTARMVKVWWDDYARLFYRLRPDMQTADIGDLTDRIELRKRLKCRPFSWFLREVHPTKFIPDENVIAHGYVKSARETCLDIPQKEDRLEPRDLGIYPCHYANTETQLLSLSKNGEIRNEVLCADAKYEGKVPVIVKMETCDDSKWQRWRYTQEGHLINVESNLCLEGKTSLHGLENAKLNHCRPNKKIQVWTWEHLLEKPKPSNRKKKRVAAKPAARDNAF